MSDIDALFPGEQPKRISMKDIDEIFRGQPAAAPMREEVPSFARGLTVPPAARLPGGPRLVAPPPLPGTTALGRPVVRRKPGEVAVMPETTVTAEMPKEALAGLTEDEQQKVIAEVARRGEVARPVAAGYEGVPAPEETERFYNVLTEPVKFGERFVRGAVEGVVGGALQMGHGAGQLIRGLGFGVTPMETAQRLAAGQGPGIRPAEVRRGVARGVLGAVRAGMGLVPAMAAFNGVMTAVDPYLQTIGEGIGGKRGASAVQTVAGLLATLKFGPLMTLAVAASQFGPQGVRGILDSADWAKDITDEDKDLITEASGQAAFIGVLGAGAAVKHAVASRAERQAGQRGTRQAQRTAGPSVNEELERAVRDALPKRPYEQPSTVLGGQPRSAPERIVVPGQAETPTGPIVGARGEPVELAHRLAVSGIREADAKALGIVPPEYDWRQVERLRTGGAERTLAPPIQAAEAEEGATEARPAEPRPAIPDFRSAEEAEAFGRQADEATLSELQRLRRETLNEFERLRARGRAIGPAAQRLALRGQYYREAFEAGRPAEPAKAPVKPVEPAKFPFKDYSDNPMKTGYGGDIWGEVSIGNKNYEIQATNDGFRIVEYIPGEGSQGIESFEGTYKDRPAAFIKARNYLQELYEVGVKVSPESSRAPEGGVQSVRALKPTEPPVAEAEGGVTEARPAEPEPTEPTPKPAPRAKPVPTEHPPGQASVVPKVTVAELKEQKRTFISELDRALDVVSRTIFDPAARRPLTAKDGEDDAIQEAMRISEPRIIENLKAAGFKLDGRGWVVIEIPGDGTFTTRPDALIAARERVSKGFPTTVPSGKRIGKIPETARIRGKPSALERATFRGAYFPVGETGYVAVEGKVLLRTTRPKGATPDELRWESIPAEEGNRKLQSVLGTEREPAQRLGYLVNDQDFGYEGASFTPIPHGQAVAVFKTDRGYHLVPQDQLNLVEAEVKPKSWAVNENGVVIGLNEKGEVVGGLMPLRMRGTEAGELPEPPFTRQQLEADWPQVSFLEGQPTKWQGSSDRGPIYYRFSNSDDPMSDWGTAIFSDTRESVQHYGKNEFTFSGEATSASELEDVIARQWEKDKKAGRLYESSDYDLSGRDVARSFNPRDVVDSAEGYDSNSVQWLWDRVLEPRNIRAVRTTNGVVVFDPKLIKRRAREAPTTEGEPTTFGAGLGQLFAGRGGKPQWPSQEQTPLRTLADAVSKAAPDSPIGERMSIAEAIGDRVTAGAGAAVRDLARLRSGALGMVSTYAAPPKWTSLDDAIGKYGYAVERSEMEARAFARDVMRSAPNRLRQEAISRYVQAGGDEALLRQQADQSKGRFKRIYEAATQLTPEEKAIANQVNTYHDAMLQEAIDAGFLEHGVQNYMMGVWERENPVTRRIMAEVQLGKFQPNPSFIRQKVFQDYFEGEQLGYRPADSRFGYLVAARDIAFKRALAARAMLKAMHEGKASDGRPLVEVSGGGKTIPGSEAPEAYLIYPKLRPEEAADYRSIDHPALRGWKWVTKDEYNEAPVFVKGDLLLHPDAYLRVKRMLSGSAFRVQTPLAAVGRFGLGVSTTLKQTLLSFSGFHQVQEGLHAMFHGVNPFNPRAIDLDDLVTRKLVEHGMVVSPEFGALENFSEGVQASGIAGKIPGVGPLLQRYTEYLFQDYIPRLKVAMGKEAFRRNTNRYGHKLSEDEIYGLTARQADAAFGMLNRNFLGKFGRDPTLQSVLRLSALAPDFLEARTRFVAQALKPYGREQLVAVGIRGALGMYVTARILNQLLDGDPHWGRPFEVIVNGRVWRVRSVPGDLEHLVEDPRSFVYYRLNPFYTRTALEALTGRDQFGRKRSVADQLTDVLKNAVPIPLQSLTDQRDRELWESLVQSFGISETQYRSAAAQEALDKARDMMPLGTGTEERREANRVARRLEDRLRNKKATVKELRQAVRSGQITPQEARRVRQQARHPELVVNFRRLPLADALDVWDKADSDERRLLAPILRRKQGLLRNVLPAQRRKLGLRFREALQRFYESRGTMQPGFQQ